MACLNLSLLSWLQLLGNTLLDHRAGARTGRDERHQLQKANHGNFTWWGGTGLEPVCLHVFSSFAFQRT